MKYIVKSLSLGGLNNKIYKAGDEVDGASFAANPEELVKQGFLVRKENAPKKEEPKEEGSMIEDLRAEYEKLSGKAPDKRWKEDRLIDEIEKLG